MRPLGLCLERLEKDWRLLALAYRLLSLLFPASLSPVDRYQLRSRMPEAFAATLRHQ